MTHVYIFFLRDSNNRQRITDIKKKNSYWSIFNITNN